MCKISKIDFLDKLEFKFISHSYVKRVFFRFFGLPFLPLNNDTNVSVVLCDIYYFFLDAPYRRHVVITNSIHNKKFKYKTGEEQTQTSK